MISDHYQTKQEAFEAGRRVRDMMTVGRWSLRVWECRGWHFSLVLLGSRRVSLYSYLSKRGKQYFIPFANDDDQVRVGSGSLPLMVERKRRFYDPNAAARAQLSVIRKYHAESTMILGEMIRDLTTGRRTGDD